MTLIATGSEVSIAVAACQQLNALNISCQVVSMPCWHLFDKQPHTYRQQVLGDDQQLRVAIEAAGDLGWHKYIGSRGIFIGMSGFGASAPAPALYQHFQITAEHVVQKVQQSLSLTSQK